MTNDTIKSRAATKLRVAIKHFDTNGMGGWPSVRQVKGALNILQETPIENVEHDSLKGKAAKILKKTDGLKILKVGTVGYHIALDAVYAALKTAHGAPTAKQTDVPDEANQMADPNAGLTRAKKGATS